MTRLLRGALVTALALSLVAASGCGSDTKKKNEYVDAINTAQTTFVDGISKAQASGTGVQAAEQTFKNMKAAIDKVISDLKAVTPPDEVKNLHNQLISEMNTLGTAVVKASDAVASSDPQKILAAQSKLASDLSDLGSKVTNTISAINQKLHS